jgi:hypothetical protein
MFFLVASLSVNDRNLSSTTGEMNIQVPCAVSIQLHVSLVAGSRIWVAAYEGSRVRTCCHVSHIFQESICKI